MYIHPMLERRSIGAAFFLALTVALAITIGLGAILLELWPPAGWYADRPFPAKLSWLLSYALDQLHVDWQRSAGVNIRARLEWVPGAVWAESIAPFDIAESYGLRLAAIAVVAGLTGITAGILFGGLSVPRDRLTHISGRRLWRSYQAIRHARRALRPAIKTRGRGLAIAPGLVIDRAREVEHIGLFGTTGSGKSTILRSLADQIIKRGDRAVLHDTKGDVIAGLPTESFVFMAPHDQRSHAWDVAQDIATTQDARELSARLVPDSREPMWSGAAREILTGIIVSLQRCKPRMWSWQDLADVAFLPLVDLRTLLEAHYPAAAGYVELDAETGAPSRTTHGIMITLWADVVGIILPLAAAWGDVPTKRRFSLTAWIADDQGKLPKVLVLQRSPRYPKLSTAWIGAAVESLANVAAGPDLSESERRRVFFVLDEFAQLGKVNAFRQLLEVGRSKGVAAVLALQDIQQLISLYGEPNAKSILTLLGLKIIGKLPAGPSATYVANELIGQREVVWCEKVCSTQNGRNGYPGSVSHSWQSHRATIPVITPQQLESRLGADRGAVTALLLGLGDVFELHWQINRWPQRRQATLPAHWTQV